MRVSFQANIGTLERDLAAIDHTLGLHEIRIDPERIAPIKTQTRLDILKRGAITNSIFKYLSAIDADNATTREIAVFVAKENGIDPDCSVFAELRRRVRQRLKMLCIEKRLRRWHRLVGREEGRWSLVSRDER